MEPGYVHQEQAGLLGGFRAQDFRQRLGGEVGFAGGLVERRGRSVDRGAGRLAAALDERIAARHASTAVPPGEDACAAVMRALVGNDPAPDDIAVLMLSRHRDGATAAETPRPPG